MKDDDLIWLNWIEFAYLFLYGNENTWSHKSMEPFVTYFVMNAGTLSISLNTKATHTWTSVVTSLVIGSNNLALATSGIAFSQYT